MNSAVYVFSDSGQVLMSFCDDLFGDQPLDKQQMNHLVWGDNLLAMQALLAQCYEGKINLSPLTRLSGRRSNTTSRVFKDPCGKTALTAALYCRVPGVIATMTEDRLANIIRAAITAR